MVVGRPGADKGGWSVVLIHASDAASLAQHITNDFRLRGIRVINESVDEVVERGQDAANLLVACCILSPRVLKSTRCGDVCWYFGFGGL